MIPTVSMAMLVARGCCSTIVAAPCFFRFPRQPSQKISFSRQNNFATYYKKMDDHVMLVQGSNLDDMMINELSREHMLDIDEITQKSKTMASFEEWSHPAFIALVRAIHEPEYTPDFNKYWYDVIVAGGAEELIRDQETKLQLAEQSLQHIIEISNVERSNQLAGALRETSEAHRNQTRERKAHISAVVKHITNLDSNISRIIEQSDKTLSSMHATNEYLKKCANEASDIDARWRERILETIDEEYEKHVSLLQGAKTSEIGKLKQQVLDVIVPMSRVDARKGDLSTSPQLLLYQKACSDHSDAIGLWNMLLAVSCVSGSIGGPVKH